MTSEIFKRIGIGAAGLTLVTAGVIVKKISHESSSSQPKYPSVIVNGSPTPTPPETPTSIAEEQKTRLSDRLFGRFAQDIVDSNPQLDLDIVTSELKTIAETIPAAVPFVSGLGESLIPNVATGGVVQTTGSVKRNAPEGGFHYASWGNGKINFDGKSFNFPWKENNVYQTFVIGKPDDTTNKDLNTTFALSDYAAGHVYVNQATPRQDQEIPSREVINREWLAQQLWWGVLSGSNCGVGCESTITLDFVDAYTKADHRWKIKVNPQEQNFAKKLKWRRV